MTLPWAPRSRAVPVGQLDGHQTATAMSKLTEGEGHEGGDHKADEVGNLHGGRCERKCVVGGRM